MVHGSHGFLHLLFHSLNSNQPDGCPKRMGIESFDSPGQWSRSAWLEIVPGNGGRWSHPFPLGGCMGFGRELPWFTYIYCLNLSQRWVNMPYMEHLEKKTWLQLVWMMLQESTHSHGWLLWCVVCIKIVPWKYHNSALLRCVFFSDFQHIHQVLIEIFQFMISSPSTHITIGKWWNAAYDKSSMETSYPSSNLPLGIQMSHKKNSYFSLYWLFNRDPGSL